MSITTKRIIIIALLIAFFTVPYLPLSAGTPFTSPIYGPVSPLAYMPIVAANAGIESTERSLPCWPISDK